MRNLHLLSLLAMILPALLHAEPPALPRGLGFRIEGQKETSEEIRQDILFIRQGITEANLSADLKTKLDALLAKAHEGLDAKTPEQAAPIRDRFDRDAGALLSAQQREEVQRRTKIVFAETFVLGNGMAAEEIDEKVVVTFKLTIEQTKKIRDSLTQLSKKLSEDLPETGPKSRFAVIVVSRKEMRDALTPAQRAQLDETIEKALKAASEESGSTKEKHQ